MLPTSQGPLLSSDQLGGPSVRLGEVGATLRQVGPSLYELMPVQLSSLKGYHSMDIRTHDHSAHATASDDDPPASP